MTRIRVTTTGPDVRRELDLDEARSAVGVTAQLEDARAALAQAEARQRAAEESGTQARAAQARSRADGDELAAEHWRMRMRDLTDLAHGEQDAIDLLRARVAELEQKQQETDAHLGGARQRKENLLRELSVGLRRAHVRLLRLAEEPDVAPVRLLQLMREASDAELEVTLRTTGRRRFSGRESEDALKPYPLLYQTLVALAQYEEAAARRMSADQSAPEDIGTE